MLTNINVQDILNNSLQYHCHETEMSFIYLYTFYKVLQAPPSQIEVDTWHICR